MTIDERWSNLQIAWYRYVDLEMAPAATNQIRLERLAAVNQAISDYMAVPSVPDLVHNVSEAWSRLTDLAYDCISAAEAWGALEQFAKQAGEVLDAAKKASDAKDTFDKSLLPPSTSK